MFHYQIRRKEDDQLLYDSRVQSGFPGFPSEDGAKIAAKAKIMYSGIINETDYDIKTLPQIEDLNLPDYVSAEEFDNQLNG